MPVEDRAADTWEPLIAIADLAGGDWPARARRAAVALTAEDDTDTSLAARLLADLRDVFGDADAMHGDAILTALHKIAEAPWEDYFGHPLNARDLARLLKPYGVRSLGVKIGGVNQEGLPARAPARPVDPLPATRARGKRYLRYLRYRAGQRTGRGNG